jgi:hypothetical protein
VNPQVLPERGQIPHFLPEGGNENSPGWSPPQRTQSWETAPNKFIRPGGAERDSLMPSSDVHAIALKQTRSPVFPAPMNYDSVVEQFSPRLMPRGPHSLKPHRPLRSILNPKEGGIDLNVLFKNEGQNPGIQPALSQPATTSQKTGRDGCAPISNRSSSLGRQF